MRISIGPPYYAMAAAVGLLVGSARAFAQGAPAVGNAPARSGERWGSSFASCPSAPRSTRGLPPRLDPFARGSREPPNRQVPHLLLRGSGHLWRQRILADDPRQPHRPRFVYAVGTGESFVRTHEPGVLELRRRGVTARAIWQSRAAIAVFTVVPATPQLRTTSRAWQGWSWLEISRRDPVAQIPQQDLPPLGEAQLEGR
jgi:hypothetical protein